MTTPVAFLQHSEWDVPGTLGVRARELGFATEAYRADRGSDGLPPVGSFDVLVVMGSVQSTIDPTLRWIHDERRFVGQAVADGVPVLGVCFGGQLLAQVLGGVVARLPAPEIGWRTLETVDPDRMPAGPWVVWHEDGFTTPPGSQAVARTDVSPHAFIMGPHTGLQFHPEVDRTIIGHWVSDAELKKGLTGEQADELLAGFDNDGNGTEQKTRQLFDGFVARAGLGQG